MKKLRPLLFAIILISVFSCEKEYSVENSGNTDSELIVGVNCRIRKIVYTDTAGTGTGLGSIDAAINNLDTVTQITQFDSLSNTIEFIGSPVYRNDTVYINADEYYILDANKKVTKMHGLADPTDPFSLQFDVYYVYDASGFLTTKNYFLSLFPTDPFYRVNYVYTGGGNLTRMTAVNLPGGDLQMDADLAYYTQLLPRRYMYIFPDEIFYPQYTQFFDFGKRNFNAVKQIKVRTYDPGNVVRDSIVSNFSNYRISADNYVLSVQMAGDDQPSIPALAGKLSFSYKCK